MRCLIALLFSAFAGKYFIFANSTFVNEVSRNDQLIAQQNELILHLKNKADVLIFSTKSRNQIDMANALEKVNLFKSQQSRIDYIDVKSSLSPSSLFNRKSQSAPSSVESTLEEHQVPDSLIMEINAMSTSYIPR